MPQPIEDRLPVAAHPRRGQRLLFVKWLGLLVGNIVTPAGRGSKAAVGASLPWIPAVAGMTVK